MSLAPSPASATLVRSSAATLFKMLIPLVSLASSLFWALSSGPSRAKLESLAPPSPSLASAATLAPHSLFAAATITSMELLPSVARPSTSTSERPARRWALSLEPRPPFSLEVQSCGDVPRGASDLEIRCFEVQTSHEQFPGPR